MEELKTELVLEDYEEGTQTRLNEIEDYVSIKKLDIKEEEKPKELQDAASKFIKNSLKFEATIFNVITDADGKVNATAKSLVEKMMFVHPSSVDERVLFLAEHKFVGSDLEKLYLSERFRGDYVAFCNYIDDMIKTMVRFKIVKDDANLMMTLEGEEYTNIVTAALERHRQGEEWIKWHNRLRTFIDTIKLHCTKYIEGTEPVYAERYAKWCQEFKTFVHENKQAEQTIYAIVKQDEGLEKALNEHIKVGVYEGKTLNPLTPYAGVMYLAALLYPMTTVKHLYKLFKKHML